MVYKHKQSVTVTAGSGAVNTLDTDGIRMLLYIEPTTSTTIYKYNIVDDDSDTIVSSDWVQGNHVDLTELLYHGSYTVNITNSTANEAFTVKQLIREI